MIGRIVGGALGSAIGKQKGNHPVAGAVIGAGALFAARRLFPQRYAALANAGVVDTNAGIAQVPTDGQTMGDALPPAIPLDANGKRPAIH